MGRRAVLFLVGAAMAASVLAGAGVARAQDAGTGASPVLSTSPDDAWMTNGIVYSLIRHGDHVYVGGKFTRVQISPGGKSFKATNVARFDAETGVADPTWTPDVTGTDMSVTRVYALAAGGGKVFVGGKFDAVDGVARRNFAAVSPETGVVDPIVDPPVGSETSNGIRSMVASETKVYLGGSFSIVDGRARRYLAAVDFSGRVDPEWKPRTDTFVYSLSLSCDGSGVFAGGGFRNASGSDGVFSPRETIARFDATTGALDPWAIPAKTIPNNEVAADLAVTCERVTAGYLGRNFVRSFRLDDGDRGTQAWANKCAGNVQTVAMLGPDKVVIGGHFSQVAGERRIRIALINLSNGRPDPAWTPEINGDGTAAFVYGPWDLLVDDGHLWVGGGFKLVDDQTRTNVARFSYS